MLPERVLAPERMLQVKQANNSFFPLKIISQANLVSRGTVVLFGDVIELDVFGRLFDVSDDLDVGAAR